MMKLHINIHVYSEDNGSFWGFFNYKISNVITQLMVNRMCWCENGRLEKLLQETRKQFQAKISTAEGNVEAQSNKPTAPEGHITEHKHKLTAAENKMATFVKMVA